MDVDIDRTDARSLVTVTGDMDANTAYDAYLALVTEAEAGSSTVVVDLGGVGFMDSVGLGMLVRARSELETSYESRLQLRNPSQQVARLLSLTALTAEFDTAD
ncbi:STAS domain-containing protein [Jatrophihabitans fulvus]